MDSIKCSRVETGPEGDRERGGKPWYNLLIVDDEPLILESLYHMLVKRYGRKFLIYQAASADEALEQFKSIRVDLLMTDIRMPGMDGLSLVRIVEKEWPDCLTVFLTGHSEFEYARQAVSSRTIGYVLKLDGDRAIEEIIDKAYDRLEREYEEKSRYLKMSASWQEAAPLLQQDILKQMITTEKWTEKKKNSLYQKIQASGMELSMDESFLIAAISMPPIEDVQKMECEPAALPPMENVQKMECEPAALPPVENPQQLSEEEISGGNVWNAVTMSRIQSVIMESLKYAFHAYSASVSTHLFLLLAQSEDNRPQRLKGFLEIALSMCERMGMKAPQIYLYEEQTDLEGLTDAFSVLGRKRFELTGEGEIILCGRDAALSDYTWREEGPVMGRFNVEKLSESLSYGNAADFRLIMEEVKQNTPEENPAAQIAVYTTFASLLLQAILNYLPEESMLLTHRNLGQIANYSAHRGFLDACRCLEGLADEYFRCREAVHENSDHYIVHKVNAYIMEHLSEDLSMTVIGEVVGLHPSYLSRLYKKVTNLSLGQYITARRLDLARELLADPCLRTQSIAEQTGLNTASYFTHFFKKNTGMTPQEYRNQMMEGLSYQGGEQECCR